MNHSFKWNEIYSRSWAGIYLLCLHLLLLFSGVLIELILLPTGCSFTLSLKIFFSYSFFLFLVISRILGVYRYLVLFLSFGPNSSFGRVKYSWEKKTIFILITLSPAKISNRFIAHSLRLHENLKYVYLSTHLVYGDSTLSFLSCILQGKNKKKEKLKVKRGLEIMNERNRNIFLALFSFLFPLWVKIRNISERNRKVRGWYRKLYSTNIYLHVYTRHRGYKTKQRLSLRTHGLYILTEK